MKNGEMTLVIVGAGVLIAGAADLVVHREKIQRSLWGQEQHYTTKHRGVMARLAHAVAAHTWTGQLISGALQRVPDKLES